LPLRCWMFAHLLCPAMMLVPSLNWGEKSENLGFKEVLIDSSCRNQPCMLSFPRRRESIAIRSAAVDSRLRGNDEQWHFYPKLE
ncbi:MAG: hypothetical protein KBH24_00460, partial [Brachymonas sp.]|nr:hypothetical protein [Brachymonas sp.]